MPTSSGAAGSGSLPSWQSLAQPTPAEPELSSEGRQAQQAMQSATAEEDGDENARLLATLWMVPPWLFSCLLHATIFLILALIPLLFASEKPALELDLYAADADQLQEEELFETVEFEEPVELAQDVDGTIFEPELTVVEFPAAAPPETDLSEGIFASGDTPTVYVGQMLSGREPGVKKVLLEAYGGNAQTEAAVAEGLAWLIRKQRSDGSWSLTGRYPDGAETENHNAATAMALLAFQGAGYTHQSDSPQHRRAVVRGWNYLLKQQTNDGGFIDGLPANHQMYTHSMAAIALCELYGMTQDSEYRAAAQRAIDFLVRGQSPPGGWRYTPGRDSDLSVTGWAVMALQSARMAGLDVPKETVERVDRYLDQVAEHGGAQYAYQPRRGASLAMSAEGLLCRQYLGWQREDPRLQAGMENLLAHPIDYRNQDLYYWYYATQVAHHMEGEAWQRWNEVMRREVPAHQVTGGTERGSWNPEGDRWSKQGGRLFTTCLSLYMLEVYYRHLPIYTQPPSF